MLYIYVLLNLNEATNISLISFVVVNAWYAAKLSDGNN